MIEQEEIDALAHTWQSVSDAPPLSVPSALRRRTRQRAVLGLEMLAAALALVSGPFLWSRGDGLVLRVSAVVLVAIGIVSCVVALRSRATLGSWGDWTSSGILRFRLRECEAALRSARYGLISVGVLLLFAGFVAAASVFEWDLVPHAFARFYATIVIGGGLPGIVWSVVRIRTKRRELARLHSTLEELEVP